MALPSLTQVLVPEKDIIQGDLRITKLDDSLTSFNSSVGGLFALNNIYIIAGSPRTNNSVSCYSRDASGKGVSRIGLRAWTMSAYPLTTNPGTASMYPYSGYIDSSSQLDYMVVWSDSKIYEIKLQDNKTDEGYPRSNTSYSVDHTPRLGYCKGGWDGGSYIYFADADAGKVFRWHIYNKTFETYRDIDATFTTSNYFSGTGLYISEDYLHVSEVTGNNSSTSVSLRTYCYNKHTSKYEEVGNLPYQTHRTFTGTGALFLDPRLKMAFSCIYTSTAVFQFTTAATNSGSMNPTNLQITTPKDSHAKNTQIRFLTSSGSQSTDISSYKYKISIDSGSGMTQVYPSTGYSESVPINSTNEIVLDNSNFGIGSNLLEISILDNKNSTWTYRRIFSCYNSPAAVTITLDKPTFYSEYVKASMLIEDQVEDLVDYTVKVNGTTVESVSQSTNPISLERSYAPWYFVPGPNSIEVSTKSYFRSTVAEGTYRATVTKTSKLPELTLTLDGLHLKIRGTQTDNDSLQFRVFLNGEQVLPEFGYSMMFDAPLSTEFTLPRSKINIDQVNQIKVELRTSAGNTVSETIERVIGYSNLMFTDTTGAYYSDDLGQVLKYLDLGIINSGEYSAVVPVVVKNTLGYTVQNLTIKSFEVDEEQATIEFSKTEDFSSPKDTLTYSSLLESQSSVQFYVRLKSGEDSFGTHNFKVKALADPI
ncbi:hypothetical protein LIS04_83 [Listeria phage LIS04]|nr:hypothetical protein LIS04_83 [Listeria phage LIS04]